MKRIIKYFFSKYYNLKEKIIVPPYSEKRNIILKYKEKYNAQIFIESGTFLGDTVKYFQTHFKKIISFELSSELARKAKNRFKEEEHITIIEGDSGKLISDFISSDSGPFLFWLDGHYSSEFFIGKEFYRTAKGEKNTPIVEELKSILPISKEQSVILIDDARCFTGENDYPTIKELKDLVTSLDDNVNIQIRRDIIRITPK